MPDIILRAGDLALTSFDALTIQRDLDAFADSFSFTMPSREDVRKAIKPRAYTPATVEFKDKPIITGRIEKISASMASATISLEGRSLAGSLVECSLGEPSNWSGLTLGAIARSRASLYGLSLSLPQGDSDKVGEAVGSPEGGIADFLQGLARDMGWLWHSAPNGALELIKPNGKGPVFASIAEGRGSFLDASMTSDDTAIFSHYKVTMQSGGYPDLNAIVYDMTLPIHRFKQRSGGSGAPPQVKKAAELDRALAIANALQINVTLGSWTNDSGALLEPGQIISLECPTCYINRPTLFLIAGVTLSLSASEYSSALRLVLPETYTGVMPEEYPWD